MTVAALFVEPRGVYSTFEDVEIWDEARDARTYTGPWPVVAHPPCQLWVNMAGNNFRRYGGPHNRPGNDGGCFMAALTAVRKFGGVLEHPAGSHAWSTFRLVAPRAIGWLQHGDVRDHWNEWFCEVWQSAYGHKARKRTWLYYVGPRPPELDWRREPGTHQVGWFDRVKPTLSKKAASATPPAFASLLISIARSARPTAPTRTSKP